MEKKQLMEALAGMKDNLTSMLELKVPKKAISKNNGIKALKVKTSMTAEQYCAFRCEVVAGLGHNQEGNNVLSVNFGMYNNQFNSAFVCRGEYDKDLVETITAYVDDDNTISFFVKMASIRIGVSYELVAYKSNDSTVDHINRITSVEPTNEEYTAHGNQYTAAIRRE